MSRTTLHQAGVVLLRKEECRGVMIFAECSGDSVSEVSLQLLTPAKRIAEKLGVRTTVVLLAPRRPKMAEEPFLYGADRVAVVEDPMLATYYPNVYGDVLVQVAEREKPELLLIAGTLRGRELAPYVANVLGTGITADCTGFDVDETTRDVLQIRPPFGATMLAHIRTPKNRPQMATVRPNVFQLPPRDGSRRGEVIVEDGIDVPQPSMELVSSQELKKNEVAIEKARVLVSGGRGIGSRDGFKMLESVASEFNGVVSGSRKAVDAGWITHERQVGQTGKTVKPTLYVAVGISGSAQHLFGIREAKVVAAINMDPDAPIFESADYGVIGDFREVLPAVIDQMRSRRPGRPSNVT
jgi:electron transfer flavoprotein alpha subunit